MCSCINCGNNHPPDNNESEGDTDNEDKNDDFDPIEFENKDSDYEENNSDYDLKLKNILLLYHCYVIHSCFVTIPLFDYGQSLFGFSIFAWFFL